MKIKKISHRYTSFWAWLVSQMVGNPSVLQETWVRSLGRKDSPGERNGYPLPVFLPGESMDRGAWWATVHGVIKSCTWLSDSHSWRVWHSLVHLLLGEPEFWTNKKSKTEGEYFRKERTQYRIPLNGNVPLDPQEIWYPKIKSYTLLWRAT